MKIRGPSALIRVRAPLMIEERFPQAVGRIGTLHELFLEEVVRRGLSSEHGRRLFSLLPLRLSQAHGFYDRLANVWRYEFGRPFQVGSQALFGPHVWPELANLVESARAVERLLGPEAQRRYMARLDNPESHETVLVEMLPASRLPANVTAQFEFRTGEGNRDVDWKVDKDGEPPVLFDVKRRIADIIALAERTTAGERRPNGRAPQPTHDAAHLFRSVEVKYKKNQPDKQLQGVWIVTALQQEANELASAFASLDAERVHFAVLGGWRGGVRILARRPSDRDLITARLGIEDVPGAFEFIREPTAV